MSQNKDASNIINGSSIVSLDVGNLPDTHQDTIDQYLRTLDDNKLKWARRVPLDKKIEMLQQAMESISKYKQEWVEQDLLARHIPYGHWSTAESEWQPSSALFACGLILDGLKLFSQSKELRQPLLKAHQDGDHVVIETFPRDKEEELRIPGYRGEIHLIEGTKVEELASYQARRYRDENFQGAVSLILGAGNVSTISITDIVHKLLVENEVVLYKSNPVLEYLGPLLEKIFEPFVKEGVLRVVIGGAKEGAYLVSHPLVDNIHMTGSDKTFEAIVFGSGEQGRRNKKLNKPINKRPVTAELGNVSPVIIIPGDWTENDFDEQADKLVSMFAGFNSYTCLTLRVIILPKGWNGSEKLMKLFSEKLRARQPAVNYYPGTDKTISDALSFYPKAQIFGDWDSKRQAYIIATGLDAAKDEAAFKREFWASFTSQTEIDGSTKDEYLNNAVEFANEKLWGTLSAVILVDPVTEKELEIKGSLKRAIHNLRYGTVAINSHAGMTFAMGNPWGGYPGSTYDNIQSGNCFVSNKFMLDHIEKGFVYGPFRSKK